LEHDFEVMRACVHEYLRHVRSAGASLSAAEEAIERQRARMEPGALSCNRIGVRSALDVCKMPEEVARLAELRKRWSEEFALCADDLAEAKRLCRPVHGNRYILWLHRAEGLRWEAVARRTGVSVQTCRRAEGNGMRELYALMPERWRRDPIPNAAPR